MSRRSSASVHLPVRRTLEILGVSRATFLLILSPKAAGLGLTITAANHLILSRWWNPAVEDQCNDRVYRIGQNKPVTIHVPIAVHPAYGDSSTRYSKTNALFLIKCSRRRFEKAMSALYSAPR